MAGNKLTCAVEFPILKFILEHLLEHFIDGKTAEGIEAALRDHDKYQILVKEKPVLTKQTKAFSQNLKQLVFINEALDKSFECALCGARIDTKSMHLDHEQDKKNGGLGTADNARWLHPYCDSTYKAHIESSTLTSIERNTPL